MPVRATIFIPNVSVAPRPPQPTEPSEWCGDNETVRQMAEILVTSSWQKREGMVCHPLLIQAAQAKAEEMTKQNYLSHTSPSGVTANQNIKNFGYPLPYDSSGNYVESIAGGYSENHGPGVNKMYDALLKSPTHFNHITGSTNFFVRQLCYGVGYYYLEGSNYGYYYVILTAPCP